MKLKEHVVTVLLPVHNAAKYLQECLTSLENQTYDNLQIIAIDDFSRDNSYQILKNFQKRYRNIEIYRNKKRYGLAICYNRALRVAKGRFIAFMNPNDISLPNRFKRQVNYLLQSPKTVAVGTQFTSIDLNDKKLDRSSLPQEHDMIYDSFIQSASLHPETVMINRELLPKDLLYFKSSKYPFVFTEVFIKLFQYGKVANIAHSLYYLRKGVKRYGRRSSQVKQILSTFRLWFNSKQHYDYRPPLRSLFSPLVKSA